MAKNALVVGGKVGIGGSLVEQLASAGYRVYFTSRGQLPQQEKDRKEGVIAIENVNVADPDSVKRIAASIEGIQFDLVIYNAGVLHINPFGEGFDGNKMMEEFQVNTLGPALVLNALIVGKALKSGSKVSLISSGVGIQSVVVKNKMTVAPGYVVSKAAINMLGSVLSLVLKESGVAVFNIHPGTVSTNMSSQMGAKAGGKTGFVDSKGSEYLWLTPQESAARILATVAAATIADTGEFFDAITGRKWTFTTAEGTDDH